MNTTCPASGIETNSLSATNFMTIRIEYFVGKEVLAHFCVGFVPYLILSVCCFGLLVLRARTSSTKWSKVDFRTDYAVQTHESRATPKLLIAKLAKPMIFWFCCSSQWQFSTFALRDILCNLNKSPWHMHYRYPVHFLLKIFSSSEIKSFTVCLTNFK